MLDAAEATVSRGTRELCCLLNADAAGFARAAEHLLRTTGVRIGAELLRLVVEREGRRAQAESEAGGLDPAWATGPVDRLYLGCDGFTTRLVTASEKKLRRQKTRRKRRRATKPRRPPPQAKRGADQAFKEFKLVTFYDESGERRLTSVTRKDHREAGRLMRRDARRSGFFQAQEKPAVVDGAPWIVNQIQRRSLPVDGVCLDFFHLAENVHKARRVCFGEEDPAGRAWAEELLHAAKHQGYEALRDGLDTFRRSLRSPAKRKAADGLIAYVVERREMIRYPAFLARGWQIGSGPTESQCKRVPRRVRSGGKRWDADNAEAVMALEALRQSDLWDRHWRTDAAGLN